MTLTTEQRVTIMTITALESLIIALRDLEKHCAGHSSGVSPLSAPVRAQITAIAAVAQESLDWHVENLEGLDEVSP